MSEFRVAFVDDEPANTRLGLRFLTKLGISSDNVIVLKDGTSSYEVDNSTPRVLAGEAGREGSKEFEPRLIPT